MRFYLAWFLLGIASYGAATLERDGWRRQEQAGAVVYFKGDEAMVLALPPKTYQGDLRAVFTHAMGSFLGGKVVSGGNVRDAGGGALSAEYEVQESNGTRTHRAAIAWDRKGQFEALLYATKDHASFQKHRAAAMAFFASYRGEGAPIVGEWYSGTISTIQRRDSVTGQIAPPSGNNMTYKFLADGTFQQYGLMQFTYATCVNSFLLKTTGRYSLRGEELTTIPEEGTFESRTCGGAPVRKPTTKAVSVFTVRMSGGDLTMTDNKGAWSPYRRK